MSKSIMITESQLALFMEGKGPLLDGGDTKEYGDKSEITTTATVHSSDDEIEPGEDVCGDEISHTISSQGYFGSPRPRP